MICACRPQRRVASCQLESEVSNNQQGTLEGNLHDLGNAAQKLGGTVEAVPWIIQKGQAGQPTAVVRSFLSVSSFKLPA